MAGSQVKITNGNLEGNILDNAASEYTLKQLLSAMQTMSTSGANSKKAAKELEDFTNKTKDGTKATKELSDAKRSLKNDIAFLTSRGLRIFTQGIGLAATGLINLGTEIFDFGTSMLETQLDVTDFSSAIKNSSLNVLGLGTAFDGVIKLLNSNYTAFQQLSTSGILFNGTIVELQQEAAAQRLELGQLNSILSQNSERLALLGSATDGARLALSAGARAYDQNAEQLRAWGINFEEQGELFTSFLSVNALALRRRTMSEEQLVNQSSAYAINLRQLSALTGKSVDELRQEVEKQNFSAAFDSFLAGITDDDERQRIRSMVTQMGATYGEAGAELAMAQAMGIPPITDAATAMAGVLPQLNDEIGNQLAIAKRFTGTQEEFFDLTLQRNNQLANSLQGWIDQNATLGQVLSLQGDPMGAAFQSLFQGINIFSGDMDDVLNRVRNFEDDPTANMLKSINEALGSLRVAAIKLTTNFFNNEAVKKSLNDFAEWIKNIDYTKYNPFDEEGRANIAASFNTAVENFGNIFRSFWEGPNAVALRDTISGFFEYLIEELILSINQTTGLFGGTARNIRTGRLGDSITEDDRESATDTISAEELSGSQRAYRELLDEAVELQRTLNALGPSVGDPDGDLMIGDYQRQLDQLIQRLPSGSEEDVARRAQIADLVEEYERQMRKSQDRLWTGGAGRAQAAEEARNISTQLQGLGVNMETRRIGTLQATGMKAEPRDMVAQIHQGERVLNPQETEEYNNRTGSNNQSNVVEKLDQLNNTMLMVASLMNQELAIQTRTMNNISGLGPDLMKGIPG